MGMFSLFHGGKKRTARKQQEYSGIKALYFGQPMFETLRLVLDSSECTLQLYFRDACYVLDLNRLSANYLPDLCASFLAQGARCFGGHWPDMQHLLTEEQKKRGNTSCGRLTPKDGIALQYATKDQGSFLILLISDVFLEMGGLMQQLQNLLPKNDYCRVEL